MLTDLHLNRKILNCSETKRAGLTRVVKQVGQVISGPTQIDPLTHL